MSDIFQHQRRLADVFVLHPHKALLNFRQVIQAQLRELRLDLLRRDGQRSAMNVIRALAAVDNRLRNRLTACATGLLGLVFVLDGVRRAGRNGKAAVKATERRRRT